METLEQLLRPGKEIQLEFTGLNGENIVYQTRVIRSMQTEYLALLMAASDETLFQLSTGTTVTLTCRSDSKNVFTFTTEFVEIKPGELPILIVIRPIKIENASRRNFFRCEVKLQFSYYLKNRDYQGEVINLSAGGLFTVIEVDPSIIVGTRLACKLFLPKTKAPILFVGRVIDIRKQESIAGLALTFQNLTKDQQTKVVKYLFDQQRAMLVQKRVNSARSVNM